MATIKGDGSSLGGLHSRMEINVPVHSPKPDLSVFQAYDIHKKILQSLALVMMMTGKSNLTMEEFTIFFSNINHLDIKSYVFCISFCLRL